MKKNGNRDRGVADENEPGENSRGGRELWRQLLVIQSKRLKKARGPVAEVEREEKHPEDIEAGDEIILKAVDHHRVDIVAIQGIGFEEEEARIGHADGEVGEVIKDEREQDQPAERHRARGERRLDVLLLFVTNRTRPAVLDREADRVKNVKQDRQEK